MAQAAAAPHGQPSPEAAKAVHQAIENFHKWRAGAVKLHQAIQHAVLHPAESIYQIAGVHLLPGADMKEALSHLKGMEAALQKLDHAVAELGKPAFDALKPADAKKAAEQIGEDIRLATYEAAAAAHAVEAATAKVMKLDVGIAENLLVADKAVMDKAPEIAGDIMLAITKKEAAKVLMEQGGKALLNGVANASAAAQHIDVSAEIPGFGEASLEAGIEMLAGLVPAAEGKVKTVLLEMVKNVGKEVTKELAKQPPKKGPALEKAIALAVHAGVSGALDKLSGDFPPFKSSNVRTMVSKPILKAMLAAEKAWAEGKPIKDAALIGFGAGLASAGVGIKGGGHGAAGHQPAAGHDAAGGHSPAAQGHASLGQDTFVRSAAAGGKPAGAHPLSGQDTFVRSAAPGGKPGGGGQPDTKPPADRTKKDAWMQDALELNVNAHAPASH